MSAALPIGEATVIAGSLGGALAVIGGALALGLRHGIDWDHIAAITDITSTSTSNAALERSEERLTREPALMLTDESHHRLTSLQPAPATAVASGASVGRRNGNGAVAVLAPPIVRVWRVQRRPFLLGSLYALGHGTVVVLLGVIAIVAAGFLPTWVDPVMGRVVGVTLLFLSAYLYYSLYRYFRGGELRLRSRWMLLLGGARNAFGWLQAKLHGHEHHRVAHAEQYGPRTAYGIGMIHGVGAETGTQVLVIATAVGAASKAAGMAALAAFVVGLLISNSVVTLATTSGFASARGRRWVYVAAGLLAATFSLVLGVMFVLARDGTLPELEPLVRWLGGPA